MNDDSTPMEMRKAFTEMEEAFEELRTRQDETDVSVTKVLDIVQRLERMLRTQMQAQGVDFDG